METWTLIFFTVCVTKGSSVSLDPPFTVFPLMHSALHFFYSCHKHFCENLKTEFFFCSPATHYYPTLQLWLREAALAPHFGSWCSSRQLLLTSTPPSPPPLPPPSRVPLWSCGCLWSWLVSSKWCFLPAALLCAFPSWVCPAAPSGGKPATMANQWDYGFFLWRFNTCLFQ